MRRKSNPVAQLEESGLVDRSERPTSHELFAPTEEQKQREEDRLRSKARLKRRRRLPPAGRIRRAR